MKEDLYYWTLELERVTEYRTSIQHVLTGLPSSNVRQRPEGKWAQLSDYLDDLSEYLGNRVFTVQRELEVLTRTINALPARERSILHARYINGLQWNEIIKRMPLSERTVYTAHNEGIRQLDMSELDQLDAICV